MKKQPSQKPTRVVNVKSGSCTLYFEGLNIQITCPACRTVVRPGEQHRCVNGKPVIEAKG